MRPLHAVRQRGGRRSADLVHQPGQPDRGQHLSRSPVRFVLQWQHRPDLPGGRAAGAALPVQGPSVGSRQGRVDVHELRRRLPRHDRGEPQPRAALPRRGRRSCQLGLAVRQGTVRLRGDRVRRTAERAADSQARRQRRHGRADRGHLGRGPRRCLRGDRQSGSCGRSGARWCAPHERSRLRVGEARQGRDRHRQRRRTTRRRAARRDGDRPAPGDHRRRLC